MGTRKYKRYEKPYSAAQLVAQNVRVGKESQMVNACIDNYAKCRRNNLARLYNDYPSSAAIPSIDRGPPRLVIGPITIGHRIRPFGTVKFWICGYHGVGGDITLNVTIGKLTSTISVTGDWTAPAAWYSATFTVGENDITPSDTLTVTASCAVAATLSSFTYLGASMYQLGAASGTWIDLTSAQCRIGTADFAHDAYTLKVLTGQIERVRQYKVASGNIYNYWRDYCEKIGAFSATSDYLGRYKIVKRRGVSTLRVLVLQTSTGAGNWTIRSTIGAVAQDNVVAGTSGTLTHTALTDHTYAGADITSELELEFKLDADDTSTTAGTMGIYGVSIVEILGVTVVHTVPTLDDINHKKGILASTYNNIRNTCASIYADNGRQIAMSDWRTASPPSHSFTCIATAESKTTYGGHVAVVARALAYFSTASARLRVRMGFHTTAGSSYWKYIKFVIAQTAVAAEEDVGPGVGQTFQFKDAITSGIYVIEDELAIPSDHLNSTADTWVWVLAWTEDANEYIIPDWVTVEEVPLAQSEFP